MASSADALVGRRVRLRNTIRTSTGATFKAGLLLRVTSTQHPAGYPQRCRVLVLHDGRGRILKLWRRKVMLVREKRKSEGNRRG